MHQGRPHSQTSWTHKLDLNGEAKKRERGRMREWLWEEMGEVNVFKIHCMTS